MSGVNMREAAQPVSGKTDWNADWRPVAQRVDGCALTVIRHYNDYNDYTLDLHWAQYALH